jgi:hypothetical protein
MPSSSSLSISLMAEIDYPTKVTKPNREAGKLIAYQRQLN